MTRSPTLQLKNPASIICALEGDIRCDQFEKARFLALFTVFNSPRSMIPEDGYCRNRPERCGKITVSGRKVQESTGNWKQYSSWKLPDFFPVLSGQFSVFYIWKLIGIYRKKIR